MRYREGRGVVETGPFLKSSEASITVFMRVRQFEPHLKKSLQKLAIIQKRFDRDFFTKKISATVLDFLFNSQAGGVRNCLRWWYGRCRSTTHLGT